MWGHIVLVELQLWLLLRRGVRHGAPKTSVLAMLGGS